MLSSTRSRRSLVISMSLSEIVALVSESLESVSTILGFVGARMVEFAVI